MESEWIWKGGCEGGVWKEAGKKALRRLGRGGLVNGAGFVHLRARPW